MTMNWKRNSKKYIAGILTIALAVGAGQSYGSMEVSAQERTLPGIEKLVPVSYTHLTLPTKRIV